VSALAVIAVQRALAQPLDLSLYTTNSGNGFYTNTFDMLGYSTNMTSDGTPSGMPGYLPGEWTCYINATLNYFGTVASVAPNVSSPGSMNNWTNPFIGGFFNYASYASYITNGNPYTVAGTNLYFTNGWPGYSLAGGTVTNGIIADPTYQTNEPNRCLGIRQVSTTYDPGASFVLKLATTLPYDNFKMSVDLINLDPTAPRATTWNLQYGIADPVYGVPTAFQGIGGFSASFVNNPGSNHVTTLKNYSLANGTINNIDGQVWLRIVTLATSSGTGNRETFAIDNFGLTWTTGNAGCTPATNSVTLSPPPTPVYSNATVQFSVSAPGKQPLYYQWLYNGTAVSQVFPNQVLYGSDRSSALTLANVTANNQGNYSCIISNVCNNAIYSTTSPSSFLAVSNIAPISLGYLRTLTDPSQGYAPTVPASSLYEVVGIITTATNATTGNTASYYIQDATGGMNLFVTGGSDFRPNIGDEVAATGYLNTFQDNLEFYVDLVQNTAASVQVLSNNIANFPIAKVLNWGTEFDISVTNQAVEQGTTNSMGQLTGLGSKKGSVCLLPYVNFGTNAGQVINGNYYAYVTDSKGHAGYVYFWGGVDTNLVGYTIPAFAYSVQGPLFANIVTGGGSFWSGIGVSQVSDIMTNPIVVQAAIVGSARQLTWLAVPQTYSYSVQAASTVTGPYTPLATGLKFADTNGNYTDSSALGAQQYYRVTTP